MPLRGARHLVPAPVSGLDARLCGARHLVTAPVSGLDIRLCGARHLVKRPSGPGASPRCQTPREANGGWHNSDAVRNASSPPSPPKQRHSGVSCPSASHSCQQVNRNGFAKRSGAPPSERRRRPCADHADRRTRGAGPCRSGTSRCTTHGARHLIHSSCCRGVCVTLQATAASSKEAPALLAARLSPQADSEAMVAGAVHWPSAVPTGTSPGET